MFSRRTIVTFLAALIAVAHLHCVFELRAHQAQAEGVMAHKANTSSEAGGECEFGCICKGATLVHAVRVDQVDHASAWLQIALPPAEILSFSAICDHRPAPILSAAQPSGRKLRALLTTRLI